MMPTRFVLLGFLALLLTSCSQGGSDTDAQVQERDSTAGVDAFGHMGETSGGSANAHFTIRSPFLQRGDRMTIVLLAEYPGKPLHPASVLLLKLTSKHTFSTDGSSGGDGEKHYWRQRLTASGDKKFPVSYEIRHKPVTEQITLGDQVSSLEQGRVFLVDLTTDPVQVTQVNEDLQGLLPGQQPSREDLKGVVEKVQERHESVRNFLRISR